MVKRSGPGPHVALPAERLLLDGHNVLILRGQGYSFAQCGARLGMSATTAWRRYWWVMDYCRPGYWGYADGPIPKMRGTRAIPSGRPCLPTVDHKALHRPRRRPAVRCRARRRDGDPCGSYSVHGAQVCRMHGMNRRAREAARRRVRTAEMARLLAQFEHRFKCA